MEQDDFSKEQQQSSAEDELEIVDDEKGDTESAIEPIQQKTAELPQEPPQKSYVTAYLLWLFLGWMGMHRYYAGKWISGLLYTFSFGVFGFGLALDSILTYFMIRDARERQRKEFAEAPWLFARRKEELAPWAKDHDFWDYLQFPVRFLFFLFGPMTFVAFAIMLNELELVVLLVGILVTTGLLGSFSHSTEISGTLRRIRLVGELLDSLARFRDFYYHNKPRIFLFYMFYPVCAPLMWLFSKSVRAEFRLYAKIFLTITILLMIETAASYSSTYPPHLKPQDAMGVIFGHLFISAFLMISFLMPIATTSYSLRLSGKATLLRVLTVTALVVTFPMAGYVYYQNTTSVSFLSGNLLKTRLKKESFVAELNEMSEMFLSYYSRDNSLAVPAKISFHESLTEKYRRQINGIAVDDEANAFSVITFKNGATDLRWYAIRFSTAYEPPRLIYMIDSKGHFYKKWQQVPPQVRGLFKISKRTEERAKADVISREGLLLDHKF